MTAKTARLWLALPALLVAAAVAAQDYPSRPVRMVVPTSPGGVTDTVARSIAAPLAEALGQTIVVDNRAGAGGIPGTDIVAKAAPDGHTLLTVFDSFVSNPYVFGKAPYDTVRDFAPVALLVRGPQIVVVHPKLGVRSLDAFVALARSGRARVNFATAGAATSSRLSVELFKSISGIDGTLVHYKGGGPALNDLLGGHVEAMITSAALVLPHVRSGRLHALAVSSKQRSPLVPGVPAVSETFAQFEALSWVGMLAPARTPAGIVRRLNSTVARVLDTPEQKARYAALGYEVVGSPPAEFGTWIRSETAKWSRVIRERRITAE